MWYVYKYNATLGCHQNCHLIIIKIPVSSSLIVSGTMVATKIHVVIIKMTSIKQQPILHTLRFSSIDSSFESLATEVLGDFSSCKSNPINFDLKFP